MRIRLFIAGVFASVQAVAQETPPAHVHDNDSAKAGPSIAVGANLILAGTAALPGLRDRNLAEGYVTQPMVMSRLSTPRGKFVADLTLNFEGTTLDRGELNAGMHGESYVERRHPHTLLHEAVGTGFAGGGRTRLSISAGKGFVPFGTDDPMSRPFLKYPVNHHLAQILERGMISVAASAGVATLELVAFNGDEPESPFDMPNWDRFGDSWSARLTARPVSGIELQGSAARVSSPEQPSGGGLDHRKVSSSIRYESRKRYLLAEWARTREMDGERTAFTFISLLVEGSYVVGGSTLSLRAERTERPEEERTLNVFRTPRPHSDLSIIGRTRWDVLSAAIGKSFTSPRKLGTYSPFVEVSTQRPRSLVTPTAFDPKEFFGVTRLWSLSVGVRLGIGMKHARMGRYGVAASHHARNANTAVDHSTMDME